jgi:flagellar hook-associated protein 2
MAGSISSIDVSLQNLAPTFQKAIKAIIESESAPLTRTQTLKDQLEIRRGVYTDIKTNFDALQTAVQALISTQASYGLNMVSKLNVMPGIAGSTVLTASATSDSVPIADYDINVSKLAKAESRATAAFPSSDVALNKTGTLWLGGTGIAALQTETSPSVYSDFVPTSTVTAAVPASVANGLRELGSGNYTVQLRDLNGVRQFRLVDADGNAVSIRSADGTSANTTDWQKVVDGSFDTGRGQRLTLSSQGTLDGTTFHYNAKGVSVFISAEDTLRTIAKAINLVTQPDGHDLKASIVANQLVLTSIQTGKNHGMIFSDGTGLGFATLLQKAQNAEFTINGMPVSTATNTNLTNLIDGVSVTLAGDAETKSARLSIASNTDKAVGLINTMVGKFNTALSHLKDKLASTARTEGDKTTYKRGPLTGDTTFSSLRTDLLYRMSRNNSNNGSYRLLDEIGLSIDKDLKLTLDSTKFSDALKNHTSDVGSLLDTAMGGINDLLSRFTGSSGILSKSLTSMDSQRNIYDQRIAKYNASLLMRKQSLYNQYMEYQTQLADLGRTAQMFGISLGSNVDTSS